MYYVKDESCTMNSSPSSSNTYEENVIVKKFILLGNIHKTWGPPGNCGPRQKRALDEEWLSSNPNQINPHYEENGNFTLFWTCQ